MSPADSNSKMKENIPAFLKAGVSACLLVLLFLTSTPASSQTIAWSSLAGKTNLTSSDTAMDGGFRFELGVFEGTFTPTPLNTDEWAANWRPAQSAYYNTATKLFTGSYTVTDNVPPFTEGKRAYIWGFRGSPQQAEWILFSKATWTWPTYNPTPTPGNPISWVAEQADDVILGEIDSGFTPFLMKSAAITNARPPDTPWDTWLDLALAGETENIDPDDDFDNDGASNLLEFIMGTDPKNGGGTPATAVSIVPVLSNKYLQITIPRRIDHPAILTVEVADHPAGYQPSGTWDSGELYTEVVSDTLDSLIVRDLTPISPAAPRRFMRLSAELPE